MRFRILAIGRIPSELHAPRRLSDQDGAMATLRTEVTEIVTGLGMLGLASVDEALAMRPSAMVGVEDDHYRKLIAARADGKYGVQFEEAWANGMAFAEAEDGLRGRVPRRVEWKGPHQAPSYEQIPADLRIDHVYLVSCKYGSNLLHNVSPSHLFDRLLARRHGERVDWYAEVAPDGISGALPGVSAVLEWHRLAYIDPTTWISIIGVCSKNHFKVHGPSRWPNRIAGLLSPCRGPQRSAGSRH